MLRLRNLGRLPSFLMDALAIVVGLTLSFMIDEWRDERKKLDDERAILNSIKLDLKADIVFANRAIQHCGRFTKEVRQLLDPNIRRAMQPDSLSRHLFGLAHADEFMGNDHTFNAIAAETRDIISDVELRRALQFYYSVFYGAAKDVRAQDARLQISRVELMRKRIATVGVAIFRPWYILDEMHNVQFEPNSADEVFATKEFRAELHWALQWKELVKYIHEERIAEIERLLGLIDSHLKTS